MFNNILEASDLSCSKLLFFENILSYYDIV